MTQSADNVLYYGDNLDILQRYVKDECVDLVYLDPPFNSNASYNVLFAEKDGSRAASQIEAFQDTWTWTQEAESVYADMALKGDHVAECLQAFRRFFGTSDMLAYLVMMAPRLVELRRVMKPTASIYLHCDPTASHYLKMLMDAVFGAWNFRNEIIWKRTSSHNRAKRWGTVHDVLLFYTKSETFTWNRILQELDESYVKTFYRFSDERGRYRVSDLTGPGIRTGDSGQPWRDVDPAPKQRHWEPPPNRALPEWFVFPDGYEGMSVRQRLDVLDEQGLIYWPTKRGGMPGFKRYLLESAGIAIQDVVTDIGPISARAAERLGYPTQKPEALLERIVKASSNEGDVVLDPFCGCGTTVAAAQKLNRRWMGIDITQLAINLIKTRLQDTFGTDAKYHVIGEPVSVPDAQELAESDPYQFQWWTLGLAGARPAEQKKGADKGIDGKIVFQGDEAGSFDTVILSVNAGKTGVAHVRDLKGVLEREKADIGVLISMQEPTRNMKQEAAEAGFYESTVWGRRYPKVQLLTVAGLLEGETIDMPPVRQVGRTFKKAPKATGQGPEQDELPS